MAIRRIYKEITGLVRTLPDTGWQVFVNEDNVFEWKIALKGPPETCYQEGIFWIKLSFPADYPFKAPTFIFLTNILHPNITEDGYTSFGYYNNWSPSITIGMLIKHIITWLVNPNPDEPANWEVAWLMKSNRPKYEAKVKKNIKKYAS